MSARNAKSSKGNAKWNSLKPILLNSTKIQRLSYKFLHTNNFLKAYIVDRNSIEQSKTALVVLANLRPFRSGEWRTSSLSALYISKLRDLAFT